MMSYDITGFGQERRHGYRVQGWRFGMEIALKMVFATIGVFITFCLPSYFENDETNSYRHQQYDEKYDDQCYSEAQWIGNSHSIDRG